MNNETIKFSRPLKVLDLFCGLKGWSEIFTSRQHDVRTLDFNQKFYPTYTADILTWSPKELGEWKPDVILASPPCEGFTVMNIGKNWHRNHTPKTATASKALSIMKQTIYLCEYLDVKYYWIENPRAKMRRLMEIYAPNLPRVTVTYCQYGQESMKPTDLWGKWPKTWNPKPPCKNGDSCHLKTPRGTTTHGTQRSGVSPENRAKIPYNLAKEICIALETEYNL